MAGVDPTGAFQGDVFRAAIKATMQMGTANLAGAAPTFRWLTVPTYSHADAAGEPFNWTSAPSSIPAAISDLAVDCAVELGGDSQSVTAVGEIDQVSVALYLLDADYALLTQHGGRIPDQVLLKGIPYNLEFVPAPLALFEVDVYIFYCTSTDSDGNS